MPSADTVVSGSRDTTLRVRNVESGRCLHVLEGHTETVRFVFAQGDHIVSGSYDKRVKSWSLSGGQCLSTSDANEERIFCMARLKRGTMVACGSLNGRVCLYDVPSLSVRGTLGSSTGELTQGTIQRNLVNLIKEGEDGTLLTGNLQGMIHVYDIQGPRRKLERSFVAHTGGGISALIVFDSRNILTSGPDGKVRLWDLDLNDEERGAPVAEIGVPADKVWRVVNVGHTVIIALMREDKTIIEVWDLELTTYPPRELKTRKEHLG